MRKYWKKNIGVLIVALLLGTCSSLCSAGVSLVLQEVIDVAVSGKTQFFAKLFIFTIVYILFLCIVNYLSSLPPKYLTEKMLKQYRKDVFEGIISRQPVDYYTETTVDYVSAMTMDSEMAKK
jgi:ABC-type multidrug transport system, ATPase and permease components